MGLPKLTEPGPWQQCYEDQDVRTLAEWGITGPIETVRLVPVEKPRELRELDYKVASYWEKLAAEITAKGGKPRNGIFHGVANMDAIDVDGKTLVIGTYQADFATLRFKLDELFPDQGQEPQLTAEEKGILQDFFHILGVSALTQSAQGLYLFGRVQKDNFLKGGMTEYVPQGFLDRRQNDHDPNVNAYDQELLKELEEETSLTPDAIEARDITRIIVSDIYSNLTVLSEIRLRIGYDERTQLSREHDSLVWYTRPEILEIHERRHTSLVPTVPRLFEKSESV
ncbi:hypothetical protein COV20_03930 [Candidatus Woesearchaeota archaeon CG10_big_fil_rev_8_21_14_0_10_45_16]|nr:MAG: hypothetical protein COV20_03930 [Candidatus Woesearchaeota archaeon CG10_big_fil_rev_8_21_14_0_10_45_16]